MKSITVYAHRHDETRNDCTIEKTRMADFCEIGKMENGRYRAFVWYSCSERVPIRIKIKASPRCWEAYSGQDYADLAATALECRYNEDQKPF